MKTLILLVLALTLSGCSNYFANFGCPVPKTGRCESSSQIYERLQLEKQAKQEAKF